MQTETEDDESVEEVIAEEEVVDMSGKPVHVDSKGVVIDDDDEEAVDQESAFTDEPLEAGKCTVEVTMVIHPVDDHPAGQLVTISATSHGRPGAFMINHRLNLLGPLPPAITEAIQRANGQLEIRRQKEEAKKVRAEQEKAAAAAKIQADKEKAANAKKEKIEKAKAKKQAERDRLKKKKEAEKAKIQKAQAAEKAKAEKETQAQKKQLEKEKTVAAIVKQKEEAKKPVPAAEPAKQEAESQQLSLFN